MTAFFRALTTLTLKNFRYLFLRRSLLILLAAFVFPITIGTILSFGDSLFSSSGATYGTSDVRSVLTVKDAFRKVVDTTGRDRMFLVNSGLEGGDVDRVFDEFQKQAEGSGMKVLRSVTRAEDLTNECESTARGVTKCFGAVVMLSSPSEGDAGIWKYLMQYDASLASSQTSVDKADNPAQVYFLPVQRSIDAIIASLNETSDSSPLEDSQEFSYTYLTQDQVDEWSTGEYELMVSYLLGVVFLVPMIIITFHLTGFISGERESGMSQLIDSMSSAQTPWQSQVTRMLSSYVAFVAVYLPSWIVVAITLKVALLPQTNFGIILCLQILGGLAITSWAVLFGSFFNKAMLSGIVSFLFAVALGLIAQMVPGETTESVHVVSALFAPANYVYFLARLAERASEGKTMDLMEPVTWGYPPVERTATPIIFPLFFILQIFLYLTLAFFVERWLHGTASPGRNVLFGSEADAVLGDDTAVRLEGFSKTYEPGFWARMCCRRRAKAVVAVEQLDLSIRKGQIVTLLGANGSGKSTTLDCIGGLRQLTSGTINIGGKGGMGIAPQRNVLWGELTVEEHISIFNRLKSAGAPDAETEIVHLMDQIGLLPKRNALAKTLSGGQMRKLQLGMMLTGGSEVCCVDEVSTGVDPLSRRNIWDILMAVRGDRTLILTTHFLDEADVLADHVAILSKGKLRAEGSAVELKDTLGGGYRIQVPKSGESESEILPSVDDVVQKDALDGTTYVAPDSTRAATVIKSLRAAGIKDYRFSNPTLEDVFLQLEADIEDQTTFHTPNGQLIPTDTSADAEYTNDKLDDDDGDDGRDPLPYGLVGLEDSRIISFLTQARILFRKRLTVLKRSYIPSAAALILPIVVGCCCSILAAKMKPPGCKFDTGDPWITDPVPGLFNHYSNFLVGPSSRFDNDTLQSLISPVFDAMSNKDFFYEDEWMSNSRFAGVVSVDTFEEFEAYLDVNRSSTAGGAWLGDDGTGATFAWSDGYAVRDALASQSVLDMLLTNTSISTSQTSFEIIQYPSTFHSIQLLIFMSLVLIVYPPLLAIYPSYERRLLVRGMQYSNGVQPLALWLAYLTFDFVIVLASTVVITAAWAGGASEKWYHVSYMFPVLFLYGCAAVMFSHLLSLATRSQLAAWAMSIVVQVIFFVAYFAGTVAIAGQVEPSLINIMLYRIQFALAIFVPIVSVIKALFVGTNMYLLACDGQKLAPDPSAITLYGGPILYLIVQLVVFTTLTISIDGGYAAALLRKLRGPNTRPVWDESRAGTPDPTHDELARIRDTGAVDNGLRVMNISKSFGNNLAVDDVSFGIKRGEIFALLGPNGAGKSTAISLIRGDLEPDSPSSSDIFVEDYSVLRTIAAARTKLGVCPQFDALDLMTVRQHLAFYARIHGVRDVQRNVDAVLQAIRLNSFADRQASALSGGNKRKLSLGIALMGNPSVLLLDEPSSGLDAASKRVMWRTLLNTAVGRSILLTTHSLEEADALAGRVGIMSHRMLALDTPDELRRSFGDMLHVHLICASAPRTSREEMAGVLAWVKKSFRTAEVEDKTYHGQIRFTVQGSNVMEVAEAAAAAAAHSPEVVDTAATSATTTATKTASSGVSTEQGAVGHLVLLLEGVKAEYGISHYSITPTTLDKVFLTVVRAHSGEEENQYEVKLGTWGKVRRLLWS